MKRLEPGEAPTIIDALFQRANTRPDALAYVVGGQSLTFGELRTRALRLAAVLRSRGLRPSGRCGLILPTSLELICAIYGVQLLGAIPIVINPSLPADLIVRRMRLIRCGLAVAQAAKLPALEAQASASKCDAHLAAIDQMGTADGSAGSLTPAVDPDSFAFFQLTSGTSGEPRAAMVRQRNLMALLDAMQTRQGLNQSDVMVSWLPIYHDLGLVKFVFGSLLVGITSYLMEPSMLSMRRWLYVISKVHGTITGSPDFGYRLATRMVPAHEVDLASLRWATNGGEAVRRSTVAMFQEKYLLPEGVLRPGYGLAEATLGVSQPGPGEPIRCDSTGTVSCGPPFDGVEVRIVHSDGHLLPAGEAGEIVVGGPTVFAGYFDDEAGTREVLRDGWLHTGDVGFLDVDGNLYIQGRRRALIKRAGAVIAPREVEEAVERVAEVRLSAAVGVASDDGGTEDLVVVAEVAHRDARAPTRSSALISDIAKEVTRALGFAPGHVLLVSPHTIPRTPNGKIRYDELRRLIVQGELDCRAGGPSARNPIMA